MSTDYLKLLLRTLQQFREHEILCDTIVVTDDRELHAHSVILAAASPFICSSFTDLTGSSCATPTASVRYSVNLPGCDAAAAEIVLRFLYTGKLTMPIAFRNTEDFRRILNVCKMMGVDVQQMNGTPVSFEGSTARTDWFVFITYDR